MSFSAPYFEGLLLGASLIIAIGAQNLFVLRQGLRREQVFLSAAFCAASDLALIVAGVFGLGSLVSGLGWFLPVMTWGGAAFLAVYGALAALRALRPSVAQDAPEPARGAGTVAAALAAFTFLNPHVYLDTVLLLGGLGARHPAEERPWFVAGAASASVLWFFGLAYGARFLEPWFCRPGSARILDGAIALVMLTLAASLVVAGINGVGRPA